MNMKLGVMTIEQLGHQYPQPNRPSEKPKPPQKEENLLQAAPSAHQYPQPNRAAIYTRNLSSDQDPEQKIQDDLARCRDYCKQRGLELAQRQPHYPRRQSPKIHLLQGIYEAMQQ